MTAAMTATLPTFLLLFATAFARQSEAMNLSLAAVAVNSAGMGREEYYTASEHEMAEEGSGLTPTEQQTIMALHNWYRCMHGANPVKWSKDVAEGAKKYILKKTTLVHDDTYRLKPPAGPAAENLAFHPQKIAIDKAVTAWYEECELCTTGQCATFTDGCEKGKRNQATGHFTAMVWKGVKEIGCAVNQKGTILCCRYYSGPKLDKNTPNLAKYIKKQVENRVKTPLACEGYKDGGAVEPDSAEVKEAVENTAEEASRRRKGGKATAGGGRKGGKATASRRRKGGKATASRRRKGGKATASRRRRRRKVDRWIEA